MKHWPKDVSGNDIKGLGEKDVRGPTPAMWHDPEMLAHGDVQTWFWEQGRKEPSLYSMRDRRQKIIDQPDGRLASKEETLDPEKASEIVKNLAKEAGADLAGIVQHPRLREQLLRMRERDQSVRDNPHPDWQAMRATDQANTEQLIAIVERHGWPTAGLVGQDGADAAWLIVQHAPDVAVMKRFLALIDRHSATGSIPRRHFAYLHDSVAMLEGRPQLFGTQFRCDHADGRVVPYPFQDPVNIDALREAVGLYPIDLYWCAMIQVLEAPCGPALAPPG